MTESEAKAFMLIEKECINRDCDRDCAKCDIVQTVDNLNNAYDMAIKALEEVQQYRENEKELLSDYRQACKEAEANARMYNDYLEAGTVEECLEAVEKQIPKKIIFRWTTMKCPTCENSSEIEKTKGYNFCPNCGQRWDWSGEE